MSATPTTMAAESSDQRARPPRLSAVNAARPGLLTGRRPRPEGRLAPAAPEQVAAAEHGGADRPTADVARLTGAAVDVDLSPVVVVPRRRGPSPRARARDGPCRSCRCARPRPSARPGRPTSPATARRGASGPGAAGGSGAGTAARRGRRCRHRRPPTGPSAGSRSVRCCAGSAPRPAPDRRRGGAGRDRCARATASRSAVVTSAQVVAPRRSAYALPSTRTRRSRTSPDGRRYVGDQVVDVEGAVEPEVDVDEAVRAEVEVEVLAPGLGVLHLGAVQLGGGVRRTGPADCRPAPAGRRTRRRSAGRAGGGCAPQAWSLWLAPARLGPTAAEAGNGGSSPVDLVRRHLADPSYVPLVAGERRARGRPPPVGSSRRASASVHRPRPPRRRCARGPGTRSPPTRRGRRGSPSPCWPRSARRCPNRRSPRRGCRGRRRGRPPRPRPRAGRRRGSRRRRRRRRDRGRRARSRAR